MSDANPAATPDAPASDAWLDAIAWDANGLIPAIAQEKDTGDILMLAWMNREALRQTAQTGQAVYYSRSRGKLWRKGEESGHFQTVHAIRTDCDSDVILLTITQHGHQPAIACHTGRHSCFYQRLENPASPAPHWQAAEPVLKDPQRIYKP